MILDVDFLIDFFTKNSELNKEEDDFSEIGEQEGEAAAPSTGGGGGSIPKWADSYTLTRGKGNQIALTKWDSGLTRGAANKIW
jgi:hypothetical protein